jgi:dCTP deaminase
MIPSGWSMPTMRISSAASRCRSISPAQTQADSSAIAPSATPAWSMSIAAAAMPSTNSGSRSLILDPGEFYILASKEAVQVPPDYAAEMVPFDPLVGEFRVHYAGFFDPGFGYAGAGGQGSRAVLEVRSREVPFILEHGQIVGRLVYEKMLSRPDAMYGQRIGSNYQAQGLKLSKHFRV